METPRSSYILYLYTPGVFHRWYFQQLIIALDYLHRKNVGHRDLKLENTLLATNPNDPAGTWHHIKLADFGFAVDRIGTVAHSRVGTPNYMAPEVRDFAGKREERYKEARVALGGWEPKGWELGWQGVEGEDGEKVIRREGKREGRRGVRRNLVRAAWLRANSHGRLEDTRKGMDGA